MGYGDIVLEPAYSPPRHQVMLLPETRFDLGGGVLIWLQMKRYSRMLVLHNHGRKTHSLAYSVIALQSTSLGACDGFLQRVWF